MNYRRYISIVSVLLVLPVVSCTQTQHLLSKFPTQANSKEQQEAKSSMESQDYAKAIALYSALLAKAPANQSYQLALADAYRLSGDTSRAHPLYDKLISTASRDSAWIGAMEGKGLCFMQEGSFEEAITRFNVVVTEDAGRWRTLNAIGVALALTKRPKEAMEYYQMALQVSNNAPAVLNNMGLSLALAGETNRGIGVLEKALGTVTNSKQKPRIALNLALVYGIAGRMPDAERVAKPYLAEGALYNNLGYYALLSHNQPLARDYLSKALASNPAQYQKAWENVRGKE